MSTEIDNIVKGVNLLRLGNNPIKINEKDVLRIIANK